MEPVLFFATPGGCSLGAVIAFEWSGLPYRLCKVPFADEAANHHYRRINPLGQTPGLLADGKVIAQSLAILNHIAARSDDPRMGPKSGAGLDRLNMLLGFLHTSYFSSYLPYWKALRGVSDEDGAAYARLGSGLVQTAHEQLEVLLGDRPWLCGDSPTIADAYFAGIVRWNDFHRAIDQSQFGRITALRARLEQLPAVQFGYAAENGLALASEGRFKGMVTAAELVSAGTGYV